jgi:hypothetical protein
MTLIELERKALGLMLTSYDEKAMDLGLSVLEISKVTCFHFRSIIAAWNSMREFDFRIDRVSTVAFLNASGLDSGSSSWVSHVMTLDEGLQPSETLESILDAWSQKVVA